MSVGSAGVGTVSGGKVWNPSKIAGANPGKNPKLSVRKITLMFTGIAALIVISFQAFFYTSKKPFEGVMTMDIWNESKAMFIYNMFGAVGLVTVFGIGLFAGYYIRHKFITPILWVTAAGTILVTLGSFVVFEREYPINVWMEQEYNYRGSLDGGAVYEVAEIDTGNKKVVNRYIIDDVVYLAVGEDDLNKQLAERTGK